MMSTIACRTGRTYVCDEALQVHPTKAEYKVYRAHCGNQQYVVKRVSSSIFELSQVLKHEFGTDPYLRTHIDDNQDESILIYEYFKDNLLSLVHKNPDLSIKTRKNILREVAMALGKLHSRQWIHLDLKPNNILLDWTVNENNNIEIERAALADLDCALHLDGEKLLNHRMGNVMWRSPEGQAGKGVGKPSEIFSFGLICLYTLTGAELLHPDFEQLKADGTEPEHVILYKLLSLFGPAPPELLALIDDEYWTELLTALSEVVIEEDPGTRFAQWQQGQLPNIDHRTKDLILKMTNLNPLKRATIDEILNDPWWK